MEANSIPFLKCFPLLNSTSLHNCGKGKKSIQENQIISSYGTKALVMIIRKTSKSQHNVAAFPHQSTELLNKKKLLKIMVTDKGNPLTNK